MEKLTITEALSEINLIKKKMKASQDEITSMLIRAEHIKDPFEREGGSRAMIDRNMQRLSDLHSRLERIRGAILKANLTHEISIGENKKTIFDWLTWKLEVSSDFQRFVINAYTTVKNEIERVSKNPQVWQDEEGKKHLFKVESNIDLGDWLRKQTVLTEILETLDGKLSLKNATIVIEF